VVTLTVLNSTKKKTVKVEIFEADLPILAAFAEHAKTESTAEAWHYAFEVFARLTDRIKELESKPSYIDSKTEAWKQAQLRKNLPFYG
jgi:hypothetical protein